MGSRIRTGFVRAALALAPAALASATLAFTALALTAAPALAGGRNPGSLLVFPEYDNLEGRFALISITNTNTDLVDGSVRVEVIWLNGNAAEPLLACSETNATYLLTPNDTLTLMSTFANPNPQRGWAYAFAKDVQGRAISFNFLIGDTLLVDPVFALDYAVNPIAFSSPRMLNQPTDLDADGLRDLDGAEYEAAPDRVLVPRFMGQGALASSELILINLTGGGRFTALVDFLVYNDNEEVFSRNWSFRCWTKVPLLTISAQFSQSFLANASNHDVSEVIGYPAQEAGWFEIDGSMAWSTNTQILDPAILTVLIETAGTRSGAETAFALGTQTNGALLPSGILGDLD